MSITIRPIEHSDIVKCGQIGYEAHKAISSVHGYPCEQPTEEFGIDLIKKLVSNPNSWGVLAERQDKILGSIFLHKFPPSPVAVIGPLTVHPTIEGGIGKALMDAALGEAHRQKKRPGQIGAITKPYPFLRIVYKIGVQPSRTIIFDARTTTKRYQQKFQLWKRERTANSG